MAGLFVQFNPFQRAASNQTGFVSRAVNRGSLIAFTYPYSHAVKPNVIHDPYPLLVVTDVWPSFVRGVNLHYLIFPYIKKILSDNIITPYSYYTVRPDKYVASAFRMYNRKGMSQVRMMDMDFLLRILSSVRSFDASEVETIKREVQNQIRQQLQIKADELTALTRSQQQQLRNKAAEIQQTLQGGVQRNLIVPPQFKTGPAPANFEQPAGGPTSTGPMVNPQDF